MRKIQELIEASNSYDFLEMTEDNKKELIFLVFNEYCDQFSIENGELFLYEINGVSLQDYFMGDVFNDTHKTSEKIFYEYCFDYFSYDEEIDNLFKKYSRRRIIEDEIYSSDHEISIYFDNKNRLQDIRSMYGYDLK